MRHVDGIALRDVAPASVPCWLVSGAREILGAWKVGAHDVVLDPVEDEPGNFHGRIASKRCVHEKVGELFPDFKVQLFVVFQPWVAHRGHLPFFRREMIVDRFGEIVEQPVCVCIELVPEF